MPCSKAGATLQPHPELFEKWVRRILSMKFAYGFGDFTFTAAGFATVFTELRFRLFEKVKRGAQYNEAYDDVLRDQHFYNANIHN
jgi:hypothetical protein